MRGAVQARARPVGGAMRMANSQRLADPVGQMLDKVTYSTKTKRSNVLH